MLEATAPRLCEICGLPKKVAQSGKWMFATWEGHEQCAEKYRDMEQKKQQEAFEAENVVRRIETGFSESGVNWQNKSFENFYANANARAKALAWKFPDRGIIFGGPPGAGKTHLMIALAQRVAREERQTFWFIKVSSWLDSMYSLDFGDKERSLERLERVPVLFIDDLGAEKLTEWGESKIERILDSRFEFQRPTFGTTNLTAEGLQKYLTPRSWSRLSGLCDFVVLTGRDNRQPQKKGAK